MTSQVPQKVLQSEYEWNSKPLHWQTMPHCAKVFSPKTVILDQPLTWLVVAVCTGGR